MIYKCEETLDAFRELRCCEWCGKKNVRTEPHHLRCRGHGSGSRLDIQANLISLCGVFSGGNDCHANHHMGTEPSYADLLAVVAAREGFLQPSIEWVVNLVLRLPKGPHFERLEAELVGVPKDARKLAVRTFREMELDWRGR